MTIRLRVKFPEWGIGHDPWEYRLNKDETIDLVPANEKEIPIDEFTDSDD